MKRVVLLTIVMLISGSLLAAENAKEDLEKAAKALAEKDNYSWTAKSEILRGDNTLKTESTGMSEKDGYTHLVIPRDNNTFELVTKGDKGAVKGQEGWRSFAEVESDTQNQQGGRFLARMIRNFKPPAAEAANLVSKTDELKKDGDAYVGRLTEEGAKELVAFGGRGGNIQVSDAKGTIKFWVKDGVLSKYSYEVEGSVRFENNDMKVKRSTEIEVRDIGTTKVVIPDEARTKAS